eukprot:jgi/Botrbrau1/17149/Bobra.0157s0043.1
MAFQDVLWFFVSFLEPFYKHAWQPYIVGLLYMSTYRVHQMKEHMFETSGPDLLSLPKGTCGPQELKFRTYGGHCNAIELPNGTFPFNDVANIGAKDTRMISFHELVEPDSKRLFDPQPFDVAEKIIRRNGEQQFADIMNLLGASWIQFNIHDWINHTSDNNAPPFKIKVGKNYYHQLPPTTRDKLGYTLNQMTPWWDLGNVYGQTQEFAYSLRKNGKCEIAMTNDPDPLLRLGPDGVPLGGANHNWWLGMEIFHTLFVKEHNHVCKVLRNNDTSLDETQLFEHTRHIIAAYVSKIHTVEWTAALLQNTVMNISVRSNWEGIENSYNAVVFSNAGANENIFKKAYDWLGHIFTRSLTSLFKLLDLPNRGTGIKRYFYGVSYNYPEEFTSAYRLHPLLLDVTVIGKKPVSLTQQIFGEARGVLEEFGMEEVIRSFGQSPMGSMTWGNYPALLGHLKFPWQGPDEYVNLATFDIFRDRERGVPRYNEFRKNLGLKTFKKWSDFNPTKEVQDALKAVYKHVDDVDTVVGMLAENPRPPGYAISETALRVFVVTASRRLLCDRFYQEGFKKETYTEKGMDMIKKITMKKIMLRHYPALEDDLVDENVFIRRWPGGSEAITNTTEIVKAAMEDAGKIYLKYYSRKKGNTTREDTA